MNSFADLKGRYVHRITGAEVGSEEIVLLVAGALVTLQHVSDCCESVQVNEIHGDINDLIGGVLTEAEEVVNPPDGPTTDAESYTWTFYKLGTRKGSVTIRWLGESNGYYSEHVSMTIRELDVDAYAHEVGQGG